MYLLESFRKVMETSLGQAVIKRSYFDYYERSLGSGQLKAFNIFSEEDVVPI